MEQTNSWLIGPWLFFEIDGRQLGDTYGERKLYGFAQATVGNSGQPGSVTEWYGTLEHAMAAAIAEKYTGPRGAGGTGVGTAADWFMKMIGADQLQPVDDREARGVLHDVIADTRQYDGPIYQRARAMQTELERRGLVLAELKHQEVN